jgi:hypothetical protein
MREINITNANKRDAKVGFEASIPEKKIKFILKDGAEKKSIKLLKTTLDIELSSLVKKYDNLDNLSAVLISEDPEIDYERSGMMMSDLKKVYGDENNKVVYQIHLEEIIKNPDNTVKETRARIETAGNIDIDVPLNWTGKMVPKEQAIRSFVFARKYQLKHVNGLTYDFLYDIAKTLDEQKSMMLIGAGKKGIEPLIFQNGGTPYRAFLEGRVKGQQYLLLIHLTNLEIKELTQNTDKQ